ncbi:hypothetical protein ABEV38_13565 [Parageobacillus thermoglucosidasius]
MQSITDNLFLTAWDDIEQYVEFLHSNDGQVLINEYKQKRNGGMNDE